MRIYLDFDGCLHRRLPNSIELEHIAAVNAILREFPGAHVVISSSWREDHSFEELRGYFSKDVADQIVGVTPVMTGEWRYDEVVRHVKETAYEGNYVVVDDDQKEFPENWAPLLLCDPTRGLDKEKQDELRARLHHACRRRAQR
jgi:hypothetical protein